VTRQRTLQVFTNLRAFGEAPNGAREARRSDYLAAPLPDETRLAHHLTTPSKRIPRATDSIALTNIGSLG
jgi:hypothetical protein